MKQHHNPVLLKESIDLLVTNSSGKYFEGTLGFGGHTTEILKRLDSTGIIVATDVDEEAFRYSKEKFINDKRVKLYNYNFSLVDVIAKIESVKFFDGVFADLGVSSFQLDNPESGFSYSSDAPLDLRMDKSIKRNAKDIVNSETEQELEKIIREYGEEKRSKKIAKKIVEKRKSEMISTTFQLKQIISEVVNQHEALKSFSRVFQALRIFINDELGKLKEFLQNSVEVLTPGGRLVLISYHSLEDRIVKEFFKYENLKCICPKDAPICTCGKVQRLKIITKKPVAPSADEITINRRSRSAKMRAAERI
jgi:16S rRNA (cytosine1402-N4)-methyltransferase